MNKSRLSLYSIFLSIIILTFLRFEGFQNKSIESLKLTTWDALGYYLYLPSLFIYDDATELDWLIEKDKEYDLIGGSVYQAERVENGNYVFRYFYGTSLLQSPFFTAAHLYALNSDFKADGFSLPYQLAISVSALFYLIIGLFLIRAVLLQYYSDSSVALGILLLVICTNLPQYVSFDSGMSHVYIFPLFAMVLFFTMKWHERPSLKWAIGLGFAMGLIAISRPTDGIVFLIPLLWKTNAKEDRKEKITMIKENKAHLFALVLASFIVVIPQLIYWKYASDFWLYNVGSRWVFFNPWWRVLFGFTNGWFIYTPITIFFIAGLFFIRRQVFKNSIIYFCLINIWIIISWIDWRYGATYSTRALVQSYPVFMLPFVAFIDRIIKTKWILPFLILSSYLAFVNLFQLDQYNRNILHFRDMNYDFYKRIYLNNELSPADMSLLDTNDIMPNSKMIDGLVLFQKKAIEKYCLPANSSFVIGKIEMSTSSKQERWLQIKTKIKSNDLSPKAYLGLAWDGGRRRVRLQRHMAVPGEFNEYEFHIRIPESLSFKNAALYLESSADMSVEMKDLVVVEYSAQL